MESCSCNVKFAGPVNGPGSVDVIVIPLRFQSCDKRELQLITRHEQDAAKQREWSHRCHSSTRWASSYRGAQASWCHGQFSLLLSDAVQLVDLAYQVQVKVCFPYIYRNCSVVKTKISFQSITHLKIFTLVLIQVGLNCRRTIQMCFTHSSSKRHHLFFLKLHQVFFKQRN